MDLSKNNRFSEEEAKNYILRTEKRKKYQHLKYLSSGPLSSPVLLMLPRKLKIIANRGSSTIAASFKLVLLCQYDMTSCIILSQRAPSQMIWESKISLWFVCFLCKALPKILKFNEVECSKSRRKALEQDMKSVLS